MTLAPELTHDVLGVETELVYRGEDSPEDSRPSLPASLETATVLLSEDVDLAPAHRTRLRIGLV
jgi:hypothetical protein